MFDDGYNPGADTTTAAGKQNWLCHGDSAIAWVNTGVRLRPYTMPSSPPGNWLSTLLL